MKERNLTQEERQILVENLGKSRAEKLLPFHPGLIEGEAYSGDESDVRGAFVSTENYTNPWDMFARTSTVIYK